MTKMITSSGKSRSGGIVATMKDGFLTAVKDGSITVDPETVKKSYDGVVTFYGKNQFKDPAAPTVADLALGNNIPVTLSKGDYIFPGNPWSKLVSSDFIGKVNKLSYGGKVSGSFRALIEQDSWIEKEGGKKMATLNVENLFLVYPELKVENLDESGYDNGPQKFAEAVNLKAKQIREQAQIDSLPNLTVAPIVHPF